MSWYRTYRPQTISELDMPAVRDALNRIRESGKFSHAYILAGPKGIGKTSSARILAKMLNCERNSAYVSSYIFSKREGRDFPLKSLKEPCSACSSCMRIIAGNSMCVVEMDAASNRGIDDIRQLRERVNLAPSDGVVSVYIIDEVHMLTTEAFNALLKVLEEPPAHVVFVLATTELHKVPETILSRCTFIQFTKAAREDIVHALAAVLKKEKVIASSEVIAQIAGLADGSFRDGVKLLEHLAQGKTTLTEQDIAQLAPKTLRALSTRLLDALADRDAQKIVTIFQECESTDLDIAFFQKDALRMVHEQMVGDLQHGKDAVDLARLLAQLSVSFDVQLPIPHLPFELACLAWCMEKESVHMPKESQEKNEPRKIGSEVSLQKNNTVEQPNASRVSQKSVEGILTQWSAILKEIKPLNATVEALLRAARPVTLEHDTLTIEVFYKFHKEQLEHDRHRKTLEGVIQKICGLPKVRVVFNLGKKPVASTQAVQTKDADDALMKAAEEVFL